MDSREKPSAFRNTDVRRSLDRERAFLLAIEKAVTACFPSGAGRILGLEVRRLARAAAFDERDLVLEILARGGAPRPDLAEALPMGAGVVFRGQAGGFFRRGEVCIAAGSLHDWAALAGIEDASPRPFSADELARAVRRVAQRAARGDDPGRVVTVIYASSGFTADARTRHDGLPAPTVLVEDGTAFPFTAKLPAGVDLGGFGQHLLERL